MKPTAMRALGLMSGTSMDGIDAALLISDGETIDGFGPTAYHPYSDADRSLARQAMARARSLTDRDARPDVIGEAEECITRRHIDFLRGFLERCGPVDLIGFHGQTVFHDPDRALTVQIGDGERLADALGIPVIFDLRSADVRAGGQGAPLVPVYHRAVVNHLQLALPVAVVNIGGVANVTWIGDDGTLGAFDTGPGNALMNDWVKARTGADYDAGGALAQRGRVDRSVLAALGDNPYFARAWPKSLDRDAFDLSPVETLGLEDGLATLAAFTVDTLVQGLACFDTAPKTVLISGGGAHNPVLIDRLRQSVGAPVQTMAEVGLDPDFIEAQAFAFCAIRSERGLPLTFPGTTGVAEPMTGGRRADPRLCPAA